MSGSQEVSFAAVIPTYQREGTVSRAISSALAQTHPPAEVVVVDDGSTDSTAEVVRRFGPPVRLISQRQSGSAAARNRGVEEASSDWIAFLDSDDCWENDHLEQIAGAIDVTGGAAGLYFRDAEISFETFEGDDSPIQVGSLWKFAGFDPGGAVAFIDDASPWVVLPIQPMLVQSSVVRRSGYQAEGGMWPQLVLRHDTHLFFKLGLGSPVCAVAGVGVTMTDDASENRLTNTVTPVQRPYWDETVLLYDDILMRPGLDAASRAVLEERLADAHWRLARIAMAGRSPGAVFAPLLSAFRVRPSFIPRTVARRAARGWARKA
jgi:glycosyltransferase involved in cell wall biosynthesis